MVIDRKKLVTRHNPKLHQIDKRSPLSVGNGEFAFTADITGLQSFPEAYKVPLGTQSQWGWHSTNGHSHYKWDDLTLQSLDTYGRSVKYPLHPNDSEEAYHWLRQNPHRMQLGQISFTFIKENGEEAKVTDLQNICQELDLWKGLLMSEYEIEGEKIYVETVCHPDIDLLSVRIKSSLIEKGRLFVNLRFPSSNMISTLWEESFHLNWDPKGHLSKIIESTDKFLGIERVLDDDIYHVHWNWSHGVTHQEDEHSFSFQPEKDHSKVEFSIAFTKSNIQSCSFEETYRASASYWEQFWETGGAIDFSGSTNPGAFELERRVVLSQYLIDIHSSGSLPPQETGLMYNSWFGKFHLEMHWWHAANLPIWGRWKKLAKSLDWYLKILPQARELAKSQGYKGARWPKQIAYDGIQSPSPIATVLIWQQPHPIFLAELCYRAEPSKELLQRWESIIIETAEFMASYAHWNEDKRQYDLGPPLIPAQENHRPEESMNPTFELEYWRFGLELAIQWMKRLKKSVPSSWVQVMENIAKPTHKNGVYLAHENCPDTFEKYNTDHPSMVGALGILPGKLIDPKIMEQTLEKVYTEWKWETSWGWDFPMCAMTAARIGRGDLAVQFLLKNTVKNTYLINGHNYQDESLTAYLPGNGGLLTAVAMMACGWSENAKENPGFPKDATWHVKAEGIHPII